MIRRWRVHQFKSIQDPVELTLAPLTVLAGANSSGKSSLIQSILLLSQTCLSKVQARPIVLNGPLLRMGSFTDICSFGAEKPEISFGFDLDSRDDHPSVDGYRRFGGSGIRLSTVSGDVRFGPPKAQRTTMQGSSVEDVQPRLLSSQISARYGEGLDEQVSAIRVSRYYRKAEYRRDQEGLNLTALAPALQQSIAFVPRFENVTADEPRRRRLESTGPILGCVFDHFLPQYLTRKYDVDRAHAEHILDSLLPSRDHEAWLRASALRQGRLGVPIDIPSAVQRMLVDAIRSQVDRVDPPEIKTLTDWRAFWRGLGPIDRRRVNTAIGAVKADIERELLSGLSPRFSLAAVTVPSPIHEAVEYIDHFFGNRVKYLGPLREEPRPLYALSGSTDVLDVGIKGEYTAAVIDTNRDVAVTHIPPSDIQDGKFGAKAVSEPLLTALAAWLRYMGVSESVETSDLGNVGHKLRVTTHGLSVPVELTHVGVGVSQVLPIVVSCLLAAPGTTLVFEQPELHLHPRVQTLLADLFLSTALTGKQCVVETHSEYLINRLRLRIAMSQERRIEDDVQIYFVQKESHQSEFVPVEVNEFGSITDWPSGFFDQSQTEAERILRAGMAKRSQGRLR